LLTKNILFLRLIVALTQYEIMFSQVQTKYKLPTLNWIALKPNQVRGTIFNELDDDRLHNQIDFSDFEERFKIGMSGHVANGNSEVDGLQSFPSKRFKKPENISLLEHTRLRNIGKYNSLVTQYIEIGLALIFYSNFQL